MIPDRIKELMQSLLDAGHEAYVIGGAVRDSLMGIEPHDWDIFTNATGEQILEVFPQGNVIGNDERQAKILTVIVDGVEISQYRKDGKREEVGLSLREHQATCDFTCNSIAWDINGKRYDPFSGEWDITQRVLRFVGEPIDRIREDPLRILRGIRFWAKFGKWQGLDVAQDNLELLDTLPKERIRDEFMKIIIHPEGIENLWCDNIIYKIIPELETVETTPGGEHHNETVKQHLGYAFKEACKITDNTLLRLAIFLHDLGKGVTYSYIESGEEHFYGHENTGAYAAKDRMKILKFSKEEVDYVFTLIKCHMYSYKVTPGKKSYIRFFNTLEAAKIPIEDYVMLLYCDHQGNRAKPRIKFGDFIKGNWVYSL